MFAEVRQLMEAEQRPSPFKGNGQSRASRGPCPEHSERAATRVGDGVLSREADPAWLVGHSFLPGYHPVDM